jgi:uncharacterized protein involved in exopolysaccharide biosynthesis
MDSQAIHEIIRMLLRRSVVIALVVVTGTAAAVGYALSKQHVYETSATILVEEQQIPDDLARSTVNTSAAERLQLIEQRLMSRNSLIALIETLGLFEDRPGLSLTDQTDLLRAATRINSVAMRGQGYGGAEISSFTITVRFGDPEKAAQIANELVNTVLEQNLRARAERARETLEFFQNEERRIGETITALEADIAAFKNEHEQALPESLEFRRAELARLEERDLEIEQRLLELENQRGTLEMALEGGQAPRSPETTPRSPEEAQLRRLESELVQKRMVYAAGHPELRALADRVTALRELVSRVSPGAAGLGGEDGLNERQREDIRRRIRALDDEIELLRTQEEEIAARRAALGRSIEETPEVEMALNAYERRHRELQEQYSVITRRRAEAETGEKLEINQQSERFEVIEQALVPQYPVEPNRKKIAILGSGVSVGLALGLAFLLELMNPALRNSAQLERQLGLRPVIAIPYVRSTVERRRRRAAIAAAAVLLLAGVPAGLWAVDEHVTPLAPIVDRVAERAGLGPVFGTGAGADGLPDAPREPDPLAGGRADAAGTGAAPAPAGEIADPFDGLREITEAGLAEADGEGR